MYANLLTQLIGGRIIAARDVQVSDLLIPRLTVVLPDGTRADVYIQSDPEGNDAGFPAIIKMRN